MDYFSLNIFFKKLNLAGSSGLQNIEVSEEVFNALETKEISVDGYSFKIKKKIDILAEFLKMPDQIIFEGICFELKLSFNSIKAASLIYEGSSVVDNRSQHREMWEQYRCFENRLILDYDYNDDNTIKDASPHTCNFLYLTEGIENEEQFISAIYDCKDFLIKNYLLG